MLSYSKEGWLSFNLVEIIAVIHREKFLFGGGNLRIVKEALEAVDDGLTSSPHAYTQLQRPEERGGFVAYTNHDAF